MRLLLVGLGLCAVVTPQAASAYEVVEHTLTVPYEVLELPEGATAERLVAGELDGYPEMIEIKSEEEFLLRVALRSVPSSTLPNFGGIVVRVLEPRGVEEVARLKPSDASWTLERDPLSKLRYQEGPVFETTVASGTYRIEVSTPENFGRYLLLVGSESADQGYGATWRSVATLYEFYGVSKIGMIRTPLVYYPLGILLLLAGFGYTVYRTRDRLPFLKKHL
jgi:hypothetical protein